MIKLFNKLRGLPKGVKASVAFFFASIITSGISYLVTPIYTRVLSTEEYGQTSVFMTWTSVFAIIAMFCLSSGVFNNGMLDNPDKRDEYSYSMLILSNIITIIFSVVILLLYPFIKDILGIDIPLLILMCVLFFFQPAYNFWTTRQRYELKYKKTVFWTIICAIASPAIAILCISLMPDNRLYARLFGAELTLIAVYIGFYIYISFKSKFKLETKFWKPAILFNLPLIPHYLSMYLLGNSNKIMISNIIGDTATAYYSVANSVAMVASIVWSSINASLIPYTYENCKKKNYKAISAVTMPILTVFAFVCVMIIMLAPEVVAIMATADYMEAIYVIPPIVGGVFFQVQYFIYANIVYYHKKTKYVMYASVTATLLNFVLSYFLISKFGYLAAGYTTIICYFVQAVLDYVAMRKVIKEKIYNMRYIGLLSLVVVLVAIFSNLLYEYAFVRYSIIAGIFVIAVIFRKKLIEIIKSIKKK